MKKVLATLVVGLFATMTFAQSTLGPGVMGTSMTVAGLPHNFSTQSWNPYNYTTTLGQQICQPCHTPHNAVTGVEAPLWNHQMTTQTYTLYQSYKDGSYMGVTGINGTSRLCLSCHDGSVALGSYGSQTGTTFLTGGANFGTDLSNDHPVSINYASALAGGYGGLRQTTYLYSTWDTTLNAGAGGYTATTRAVSTMLDINGEVQCTSCHYAHGNSRGYQLRMSNRGSALCLACHSK